MPEPVSCTEPTADDHATDKEKACVTFRLQLVVVNASGHEHVQEVARIEPDEVAMETLGLAWPGGTIPGILYAKDYPAFDSSSSCTLRVLRRSDRSRCKVVVCRRSQM